MINNIIIGFLLFCLFWYVTITLVQFIRFNRKERYEFIKRFKKGRVFVVYIIALPLLILGIAHQGYDFINFVVNAFKLFVDFIVLKLDVSAISNLFYGSLFYRISLIITYCVTAVSVLIFTISVCGINFINVIKNILFKRKKEMVIVVGYNDENYNIVINNNNAIIMDKRIDDEKLHILGCAVHHISDYERVVDWIKDIKKLENKRIKVILNLNNEEDTLNLTSKICEFIKNKKINRSSLEDFDIFSCYVFGSYENETEYNHYVSESKGCIHYMNKYKMVAFDFEQNHPLTKYMTNNEIDYDKAIIKKDAEINVFYIGFGKINKQLFLASVSNNQFIDEEYNHKKVNYYIYGLKNDNFEKNLSYSFYRHINESDLNDDYFDTCIRPCNDVFESVNINDPAFYSNIKNHINENNSYNYIIVSYSEDLDNIDLADKLYQKTLEWAIEDKTKVFVRVKSDDLTNIVKTKKIIPFGNEKEIMSLDCIIKEDYEKLAIRRHLIYNKICSYDRMVNGLKETINEVIDQQKGQADVISDSLTDELINKFFIKKTLVTWFNESDLVKRYSNKYAALNMRVKLNLVGYDYNKTNNDSKIDEFVSKYQSELPIRYENGIVKYDNNDFNNKSIRLALAIQEHYRWNAYYICNGFLLAKKSDIENWYLKGYEEAIKTRNNRINKIDSINKDKLLVLKKAKTCNELIDLLCEIDLDRLENNHKYASNYVKKMNSNKRTHSNLTSFKGLIEYREFMTELQLKAEELNNENDKNKKDKQSLNNDNDVIRYDFEFMDYIKELFNEIGFSVVKKEIL